MDPETFKKMYLGEFKQDPVMREVVEFLRYATPREVSKWKRDGLISREQIKEAREILENEKPHV